MGLPSDSDKGGTATDGGYKGRSAMTGEIGAGRKKRESAIKRIWQCEDFVLRFAMFCLC